MTSTLPERGGEVFAARETQGEPLVDWLQSRLSVGGLWAGTIDDTVVGYAVAAIEEARADVRLARIEALFVEQEARGVGVGAALMSVILEWSAENGCTGVDAWALPGDRSTKNFFEGSGFSARLLTMHHSFGPKRERPEREGGLVRQSGPAVQ
ncbi:MAG TPA: GNAT family N-acetyltransferase [Acidimicrobiales bacterium]|nr:GNAT family N-acetyltransferase [Acidimicrobiales bacterium]